MPSPFSSINTALSALRYQQAALDIASTNVANATTEGYVRRRVVGQTVGAAAAPAVWSRSDQIGSGVESTGVQRLVDQLLDTRVRREHGRQSFLDLKATAMARVENGFAEPSDKGLAKAIEVFRASLADLENAPNADAARAQVLANANVVADAFALQSRNIQDELGDQRARVLTTVEEVDGLAQQLAATNRTIALSSGGGDTATLMDTRDRIALRLAELTGAVGTVRPDGGMDVAIGGVSLVAGSTASALEIAGGINPDGTATGAPVTYRIQPPAGPAVAVALSEGEIAASTELIDTVLPAHASGLNALMSKLATDFNAVHRAGYGADGVDNRDFFTYVAPSAADPVGRLVVAIADPKHIAISTVPGANTGTGNAPELAKAIAIGDGYQQLVNGFGTQVASVQRLAANQGVVADQVDAAREQLAGVNLDEESVNMLTAQRAYQAAARVMTTVDEILDTLINRTGVVGR